MNRLLFHLKQILLIPYNLVTSPFQATASSINESPRNRALTLGLPAFVVGVLGISVIAWAEWGSRGNLEQRYNLLAEKANDEKTRLLNQLQEEQKMKLSRQAVGDAQPEGISPDDPRIEELKEIHRAEEIYLEKLIDINPNEPEFRFRLAQVAGQQGDKNRCYSLMKSIAPDEEPGYERAHLWMAEFYLSEQAKNSAQRRQLRSLALKHAEHCLVRDSSNRQAKILKGQLLGNEGRFLEARNVYEELFREEPQFYKPLVELNNRLGQQVLNSSILDTAQLRFQEAVDEASKTYNEDWSVAWINLIACLRDKKDFETATKLLLEEESRQAKQTEVEGTAEAASRHIHIKRLLTRIYIDWASMLVTEGEPKVAQQLDLLKKALSFEPKNSDALQLVARIAASDSASAEDAKAIYNPENDDDAPATVLNEMGSRALENEKYDLAIKYFELARRKSPNDAMVLNNLAYAYLVCENKNPDRALQLVNQAIRALMRSDPKTRMMLASHFYDTRGKALMQMNRMDEAAAALEMAMQLRPENEDILTALIKCYEGRDDLQAEVYRKRLAEVQAGKSGESKTSGGN